MAVKVDPFTVSHLVQRLLCFEWGFKPAHSFPTSPKRWEGQRDKHIEMAGRKERNNMEPSEYADNYHPSQSSTRSTRDQA